MATPPANILPPCYVGVWMQPADSFARWKSRGVNLLVGAANGPGDPGRGQWRADARAAGIAYMDWPSSDLAADAADESLVAWMQADEPDDKGITPEQLAAAYAAFKAAGPNKPVYLGVDLWQESWHKWDYAAAARACDWIGGDIYPLNRYGDASHIPEMGQRLDDLAALAPGKPLFACIETGDQNLKLQGWTPDGSRGPTLDEWRQEARLAALKGARPIYFADKVGLNFEAWDNTPDDIAAAMPAMAAELAGMLPTPAVAVAAPTVAPAAAPSAQWPAQPNLAAVAPPAAPPPAPPGLHVLYAEVYAAYVSLYPTYAKAYPARSTSDAQALRDATAMMTPIRRGLAAAARCAARH